LQAASAEFRTACAVLCGKLDLPLRTIDVVVATRGVSLEAAARDARYAALSEQLGTGECVVTAHHAADQAETLLLQLLRGAGLKGMAAMPACRPLGRGWHLRPLLETLKADLLTFGAQHGIEGVCDPMNRDARFDRAYLRTHVWPSLESRWPGAATSMSRAARHLGAAQELLDQSAAAHLQRLGDGDGLSISGLRSLSAAERTNVVRHWLTQAAMPLPSTVRLEEALRQVLHADDDQSPVIVLAGHALRRYRDRVCLTAAVPPTLGESLEWRVSGPSIPLGDGLGELHWRAQRGGLDAARLPAMVTVRRRAGGETLKPHVDSKTQSVQHLCQALGVVPWLREALPMIHAGDALIAVGDLWQDARWCVDRDTEGLGIAWEGAPNLVQ